MSDLSHWTPPPHPAAMAEARVFEGRYVRFERLDAARHGAALFAANGPDPAMWRYMPYGPFATVAAYRDWIERTASGDDPLFYAICDLDGPGGDAGGDAGADTCAGWAGVASFLRIAPAAGSIEVGHIALSPRLKRRRAATEAMALMMRWAFRSGYRRYEWKCDAANLASRRAAERLGLSYEGVFRQAGVVKGRNRDTAWFAAIDAEWPALTAAFDRWLAPQNFDAAGRQRQSLSALTRPILVQRDPALAPAGA